MKKKSTGKKLIEALAEAEEFHKNKNYVVARNAYELADILKLDRSIVIIWELHLQLTNKIRSNFKTKKLKIPIVAKRSGATLAQVKSILSGSGSKISLDVLFRVLSATGQHIEIKFLKAA